MIAGSSSPQWFLKSQGRIEGPISEAEMRKAIEESVDADLHVRQGDSAWYPSDVIRKKMDDLAKSGVYIRFKNVAEGPFTFNKAHELLHTVGTDGIKVRIGVDGDWVPAAKWLKAIRKLQSKKLTQQVAAMVNARSSDSPTAEKWPNEPPKPVAARSNDSQVEPSVEVKQESVEAVVVEEEPIPVVYPETAPQPITPQPVASQPAASRPVRPQHVAPRQVTPQPVTPQPVTPQPVTPQPVTPRPISRQPIEPTPMSPQPIANDPRGPDPLAGIPTHEELRGMQQMGGSSAHGSNTRLSPSSRSRGGGSRVSNKNASGATLAKVAGVGLLVVVVIAVIGLQVLKVGGKAALRQQQSEQERQRGGMFGSRSGVVASPVPDAGTSIGRLWATAAAESPPSVSAGMLFRPTFVTSDGNVDAGTAFAAQADGSPHTFVISALHLFGPAGGLGNDIPAADLPNRWQGISLQDCKSQSMHADVAMKPVPLVQAKPLPNPSSQGDVAVCAVEHRGRLSLQPWKLARETPAVGQRVYLVSEVIGSSSLTHPATVEGTESGWLIYRFDSRVELRATSGAPVVNASGQVVAVNAGGGEENGVTFGVGTPTSRFVQNLAAWE